MKRQLSILLIIALLAVACTGCKKKSDDGSSDTPESGSGGLTQALEETGDSAGGPDYTIVDEELSDAVSDNTNEEMEVADDAVIGEEAEPAAEATDSQDSNSSTSVITSPQEVLPFATEAPQPNTAITSFSEVTGTGLGFRFQYPSNWTNLPGRKTVCYIQPMTNGTVYPGRVAVTMKRLYHPTGTEELQEELVSYLKNLQTSFTKMSVDKNLDTETRFMGKQAMSTTYVAYDGSQEIKGYVITTHFERYVFVFHFLCAYRDYEAFYPSICKMRDSVQVVEEK